MPTSKHSELQRVSVTSNHKHLSEGVKEQIISLPKLLLTRNEAAHQLCLSLRTIDELVKRGDLKATKIGRSIRIRPEAIQSFLEALDK